jgi:hypothetical protein
MRHKTAYKTETRKDEKYSYNVKNKKQNMSNFLPFIQWSYSPHLALASTMFCH